MLKAALIGLRSAQRCHDRDANARTLEIVQNVLSLRCGEFGRELARELRDSMKRRRSN